MAVARPALMELIRAVADGDERTVSRLIADSPRLVTARVERQATREGATERFIESIRHMAYAGDTALHIAAAAHRVEFVGLLLARGADVAAKNRRGAEPLHYAADGGPGGARWNPDAQAATISRLIGAGADPNAVDMGGVTPLHRAVRNRCAAAVRALLDGGADPSRRNGRGSTSMRLALVTSGRGGTGSPQAKTEQQEIVRLLESRGALAR
jgi:ankyrin repeat protein